MSVSLVWFRRDLRLADNPALTRACRAGQVVPVYIHAPEEEGSHATGEASRWWLHHSLTALDRSLRRLGSRLVIRRGPTLDTLRALVRESGAEAVYWNRLYEPRITARDAGIKQALRGDGITASSSAAHLIHEPWTVRTGTGGPYRAFTPFWRACLRCDPPEPPLPEPTIGALPAELTGLAPAELGLLPTIRWDDGLEAAWTPGESAAHKRLEAFLEGGLARYDTARDLPADEGTSRLSPSLHFGEVSPRQIWHAVEQHRAQGRAGIESGSASFLAELGWREFAHHVLYHNPDFPTQPLNPKFAEFPWREDTDNRLLRAWQAGETGIPLVDAGMRELWTTGWMHNRVRMVTGSFLVKNLRLPWQYGERWFRDTLVDADLASNSLGWQWVAGSGADAAPYFRVFNPVRQGERFDTDGAYVARWVPELAGLPARNRHAPHEAPASVLRAAGVQSGESYPRPIVDLKRSREEALAAFQAIKTG